MYNVSKDLLGNKFKRIALILSWNFLSILAVITIDYLKIIFNPSYKTILLIALSAGFYLWSVVSLIKFSRQVLNNNKYRLIPLSDKKLFFSDFFNIFGCLYHLLFSFRWNVVGFTLLLHGKNFLLASDHRW